jgi:hypothetical protein
MKEFLEFNLTVTSTFAGYMADNRVVAAKVL